MAKKIINIGTQANDKSGDSLRVAGGKINDNFQELYHYLGDGTHLTVASVATTGSYNSLLDKPNLDLYQLRSQAFSGSYNDLTNKPTFTGSYNDLTNKPDLTQFQTKSEAFTGDYAALTNKPDLNIYALKTNILWGDIVNKPTFATVAYSGDYNDLQNRPTLFSGSYVDLTNKPDFSVYQLASSAFNGDYNSLTNKPIIFGGSYTDLTNRPFIPSDVADLTDNSNLLGGGGGAASSLVNGSYTLSLESDGNLTLPGRINSNSYNNPELVNIIVPNSPDTAWAYGMSGEDPNYFMQVKFWGGNDIYHGFRIYDVNSSSVPFKVDGTGTTYVNSIQFPDGSTLTTAPSSGSATASIADYSSLDSGSGNITVDLTKTQHILANLMGNPTDNRRYYLADGTEGQTIYFMPANSYSATDNVFWVDNYAIYNNGFTSSSGVLKMFEGGIGLVSVQTIVTATFVAGMWHFSGPVTL